MTYNYNNENMHKGWRSRGVEYVYLSTVRKNNRYDPLSFMFTRSDELGGIGHMMAIVALHNMMGGLFKKWNYSVVTTSLPKIHSMIEKLDDLGATPYNACFYAENKYQPRYNIYVLCWPKEQDINYLKLINPDLISISGKQLQDWIDEQQTPMRPYPHNEFPYGPLL